MSNWDVPLLHATETTAPLQLLNVGNKPFTSSRERMRSKEYARTVAE